MTVKSEDSDQVRLLGAERQWWPRRRARSSSAPTGVSSTTASSRGWPSARGFEYALSQVRYMASYGAEYQHESTGFSLALLLATERLKVIAAIHPGLWHPGVLAKLGASADVISGGRFAVNVVSGWFKGEFTALGEPWLEHDERYRRSEEFIRVLEASWTEDEAILRRLLQPARLHAQTQAAAEGHTREIFQGGNSTAARQMAGRVSDWYFMNGNSFDGVARAVEEVSATHGAARAGRATSASASTPSSSPATTRQRRARRCRGDHRQGRPARPSRASARPSSRPGSPRPTSAACGRTPSSRTSSSTTTASAPA